MNSWFSWSLMARVEFYQISDLHIMKEKKYTDWIELV